MRTTLLVLAGVLGGTWSLHTNSMDEALALPSDKAVRIALRTQKIITEESDVSNTVMPALIVAAHAYATLGEIANVLKGVFGVQEFSNVV